MKNYYKVLGLRITASDAEIKQEYRRLAKSLHPDLNMGNPDAETQLAEVNEAYEILSDPVKRAEYNKTINSFIMRPQSGAEQPRGPRPGGSAGYGKTGTPPNFNNRYEQMAAQAQAAQAAQAAQVQAQFDAACKKSYNDGYTKGYSDSAAKSEAETMPLKNEIFTLRKKIAEKDKELEYADKDYQSLSDKYTDLLAERTMLEQESTENKEAAPQHDMKASLDRFKEETERVKNKLNAAIDANVQKDVELEKLRQEATALKAQIASYEDLLQSKERDDDIESIIAERINRIKSNKKEFKNTFYGVLGLNYWATQDEIKSNYDKLIKRFKSKADGGDETAKEKVKTINEAVMTLYDEVQRAEYNRALKISEEDIERERKLEEDYQRIIDNYELTKEEEEFNAYIDEIMMLAQTGDAEAQNELGLLYYDGDKFEQDFAQAVFWFREAAKQQYTEALYNLGLCYYYGDGIEKDTAKGEGFIKQAAKKGYKDAEAFLKN